MRSVQTILRKSLIFFISALISYQTLGQELKRDKVTLIAGTEFYDKYKGGIFFADGTSYYITGGLTLFSETLITTSFSSHVRYVFSGLLTDEVKYNHGGIYTEMSGGGVFAGLNTSFTVLTGTISVGFFIQNSVGFFSLWCWNHTNGVEHSLSYSSVADLIKGGIFIKRGRIQLRPEANFKLMGNQKSGSLVGKSLGVSIGIDL
jgi:hypothetical protein